MLSTFPSCIACVDWQHADRQKGMPHLVCFAATCQDMCIGWRCCSNEVLAEAGSSCPHVTCSVIDSNMSRHSVFCCCDHPRGLCQCALDLKMAMWAPEIPICITTGRTSWALTAQHSFQQQQRRCAAVLLILVWCAVMFAPLQ